jgi:hypothetical protein
MCNHSASALSSEGWARRDIPHCTMNLFPTLQLLRVIWTPHQIPSDLLTHMSNIIYFTTQCSIEYYLYKEPVFIWLG